MYLLIDWGNTHLKFIQQQTLTDGVDPEAKEVKVASPELMLSQLNQSYTAVLVCSVKNDADNKHLEALLKPVSEQIYFARTSQSACGISCAYDLPQNLGVDRWAAVVAAASPELCVAVIDIGSAITLDVVKGKRHLGGQIAPGRDLMLNSLASTARIGAQSPTNHDKGNMLGRSTQDCTALGVASATKGVLHQMVCQLESECSIDCWLVTGGGAQYVLKQLESEVRGASHRPLLVFEGLLKLYLSSLSAAER